MNHQAKNRPLVSVGMPVYNGAPYIRESINSILSQSFEDMELIISDNASTDETEDICREFASADPRIRYVRNAANIGASDNYNAVFTLSAGTYFKWASSNDWCEKSFLAECVDVLNRRSDVVLCYPKTRLFSENRADAEDYEDNLALESEDPAQRFIALNENMRLNNIMNGVIRADILKRTPLIKPFFSSDICLMGELALYGKFHEVPKYLFYRRMDEATATKLKDETEVLRHYDPELKSAMLFQQWKFLLEYYAAVRRSPLTLKQKSRSFGRLVRMTVWSRSDLLSEIAEAMKSLIYKKAARS